MPLFITKSLLLLSERALKHTLKKKKTVMWKNEVEHKNKTLEIGHFEITEEIK